MTNNLKELNLTVKYASACCKFGFCSKRTESIDNKCCVDDNSIVLGIVRSKSYEVVNVVEKADEVFYELFGWGTSQFNAKCFKVIPHIDL
jgi:hypothetical protein